MLQCDTVKLSELQSLYINTSKKEGDIKAALINRFVSVIETIVYNVKKVACKGL